MKVALESMEPHPQHQGPARLDAELPRLALQGSVLLATDNSLTQGLITSRLQGSGATLHVVDNGLHAVQAALSKAFDLLILNIEMPVLDGVSALGLLRRAGYRGAAIALTADAQPLDVSQLRRLGFQEVLADPIELPRLHVLLSRLLVGASDPHRALPGDSAAAVVHRLAAEFAVNRRGTQEALREALAGADGSALHSLTGAFDGARSDLARRGGLQLMKALRGVTTPDTPAAAPTT